MKKIYLVYLILCLGFPLQAEIENRDKPKYGKWDFRMKPVWTIDRAQDEYFSLMSIMKIHENGKIYAFDYKNFKFYIFDSESGGFLSSFGEKGQGPGEFNMVLNFFFYKDNLMVYDVGKIHYFSIAKDHDYIKSAILDSPFRMPPSYFLDENRYLSIPRDPVDPDAQKRADIYDIIQKRSTSFVGQPPHKKKKKPRPKGGSLMFVSDGGGRSEQSKISMILGMKNDIIFYGINDQYLIKAVDLSGKELLSFSIKGRKRRKISNAYKKRQGLKLKFNGVSPPPDMLKRILGNIPDSSTYFYRIFVDDNGLIYTFVSDLENQNKRIIDIFSPKGEYLYQAELQAPQDHTLRAGGFMFFKNNLFAVLEDPDGEIKLTKYQIDLPNPIIE